MKAKIRKTKPVKCDKFYCNDCNYEFSTNTVNIEETTIKLNGQVLQLVYFACPKCNRIYRIMLKDERYEELKDDLEKTKNRIRKNNGSGNDEFARTLYSMVNKKHERLKNHLNDLNKKFPGTFTFVTSENNHKEKIIKYLP